MHRELQFFRIMSEQLYRNCLENPCGKIRFISWRKKKGAYIEINKDFFGFHILAATKLWKKISCEETLSWYVL